MNSKIRTEIKIILNGIFFYIGWLATATTATIGMSYLGMISVLIILGFHFLIISEHRIHEFFVLAITLCFASLIEIFYLHFQIVDYVSQNPVAPWFPPFWILCDYALFATTFNHCLFWLQGRYALCAILGAGGGVFSYLGGEKMGAVTFPHSMEVAILVIGSVWFVFTPVIFYINQKLFFKKK